MSDFLKIFFVLFQVFWSWGWFFIPFFLYDKLCKMYTFWVRWEFWYPKFKSGIILLEIIPPRNLAKTFKTMEDVFGALWGSQYMPANWREQWLEGMPIGYGGPGWLSLELVSIAGDIHYYARLPKGMKAHFEATIYSQYPDAEIFVAQEDYTQNVPADAPNEDWDIRGEDMCLLREDVYPLKTYKQFFEPEMGKINEERLVDPIHSLLESLTQIKSGDQVWIQFGLVPVTPGDLPYYTDDATAVIRKLSKIAEKPVENLLAKNAALLSDTSNYRADMKLLLSGIETKPVEEKKEDKAKELLLSPNERDVLKAVEEKFGKRIFMVWIRTVYIFQKNLPHDTGSFGLLRNYVQHFQGINGLRFWTKTRTKINYILRRRRLYLKKRKIFNNYKAMMPPVPVFNRLAKKTGLFVMTIEELASLFHFPNTLDSPRIYQTGMKKGQAPLNLPIEK